MRYKKINCNTTVLRFFLIFAFIIFFICPTYSIEEVSLDTNCLDDLAEIYYGETEKYDTASPALKLFSKRGIEFDNKYINSIRAVFLFGDSTYFNKTEHNSPFTTNKFNAVEPGIWVNFNENRTKFEFNYNFARDIDGYHNDFTQKITQLAITQKINENQKITIGQGPRVPIGLDAEKTTMGQDFVLRSQLGRTFGNVSSVGIRNIASYKYLDYDIGFYDSTRFMKRFGKGADFTGKVVFKPTANLKEEIGDLKIGSSYAIGKNDVSYNTISAFIQYDKKKLHSTVEYTNANGYNGAYSSRNDANGFYTTVAYDLTDKLQLAARYDFFLPNKDYKHLYSQEYSVGLTYKMFKSMKLMLNYVYRQNNQRPDSNMVLLATRFFI